MTTDSLFTGSIAIQHRPTNRKSKAEVAEMKKPRKLPALTDTIAHLKVSTHTREHIDTLKLKQADTYNATGKNGDPHFYIIPDHIYNKLKRLLEAQPGYHETHTQPIDCVCVIQVLNLKKRIKGKGIAVLKKDIDNNHPTSSTRMIDRITDVVLQQGFKN